MDVWNVDGNQVGPLRKNHMVFRDKLRKHLVDFYDINGMSDDFPLLLTEHQVDSRGYL